MIDEANAHGVAGVGAGLFAGSAAPWLRDVGVRFLSFLAMSLGASFACCSAFASDVDMQLAPRSQREFSSTVEKAQLEQAISKSLGNAIKITNPSDNPQNGGSAPGDQLGISVALSGDTALVGAFLDDVGQGADAGSAYVFVRAGNTWSLQSQLSASDAAPGDWFGWSVALSGDTAVISARLDDTDGGANAGSAYVFVRSGSTWSQQAKLVAMDGMTNDEFGISVAVSGASVIIGAFGDDPGSKAYAGSAYVFARSGSVWTQQAKLVASDGEAQDYFGFSVAIDAETVIVGAQLDDTPGGADAGSAYLFTRSGTVWSQQAKLTAADGTTNDRFGYAVALQDGTALVGAIFDDTSNGTDTGSAYVFFGSGTSWNQQAKLTDPDAAPGDWLGWSVALSGDTAVVGAYRDDTAGGNDTGSATVFVRNGVAWDSQSKLIASDAAVADYLGHSVAIDDDVVIVGAFGDDMTWNDTGASYAFVRNASSWSQESKLTAGVGATDEQFGISVALSGNTALVGAYLSDTSAGIDAGAAYVYVRDGTTWALQAQLAPNDSVPGDLFGYSVALNGDTAVIGAFSNDTMAGPDAGSAYVFKREGASWSQQAKLIASDALSGDNFGYSVAYSADTAVIGAFAADTTAGSEVGSAYVFVRSGTTWSQQAKLNASDGAPSDFFGNAVAISGDTAIVGSSGSDPGSLANAGAAYVFVRADSSWTQQEKLVAVDRENGDHFGKSVALSADTAVIGAYTDDIDGGGDRGSAYVFMRDGINWSQQAKLTADDGEAGDNFGVSVAVVGNRALVGANLDDTPAGVDAGSVYVFSRNGSVWSQQSTLFSAEGEVHENFGYWVALSSDTVLIGAPLDNSSITGNVDVGSVLIFEERHTVTPISTNGGTLNPSDPIAVLAHQTASLTANPEVGHRVLSVGGCGGSWSGSNPYVTAAITADCTVTATFAINQYTVSFDTQGGSAVGSITQDFASTVTVPAASTRAGYSFQSWNTASNGSGTSYAPGATFPMPANHQTLYAIWTNGAPSLAVVTDQTVLEDSGTTTLTVAVSDTETSASALVLSANSGQPTLVPHPVVGTTANPGERTLSITPVADGFGGPVTITLVLSDGPGATTQRSFDVQVTPVNDAPGMTVGSVAAHPAGSSGARSQSNFAVVDLGPDNEDATQAIDDFLVTIDSDPNGVLSAIDIGNDRTLLYTLTGIGGVATVSVRVRDNGGTANNGNDTSASRTFTVDVAPGADLQIGKTNHRVGLLDGESTVYSIVVANAGPNAVSGAALTDNLPGELINGSWMCVQASSTATCPTPATGTGNLNASIDLGANQYLQFAVIADVDGAVGAFVTNQATVGVPQGTTELDSSNNSAVDSDPITPIGIFASGFETQSVPMTVPGADDVLRQQ